MHSFILYQKSNKAIKTLFFVKITPKKDLCEYYSKSSRYYQYTA
jgi:hypothetical protein